MASDPRIGHLMRNGRIHYYINHSSAPGGIIVRETQAAMEHTLSLLDMLQANFETSRRYQQFGKFGA